MSEYFSKATFRFLKDLASNNDRDWFKANKARYEKVVKDPATRFIVDFAPVLKRISPHFRADPRPVGGSLFRIYRDTRFSRDKSPFKTHTGIQFRHDSGKDAHAPGFYLHMEPGSVFVGVGTWRPDSGSLRKIREGLVEDSTGWRRAVGKCFSSRFELSGDSLVRPPKGFDPEHPLVEDLKRKDFIGVARLTQGQVIQPDFLNEFGDICRSGVPLVKFLCRALEVSF
ncbi:DUF2461 domain-containing protein [Gemmatimonadota bacterium]